MKFKLSLLVLSIFVAFLGSAVHAAETSPDIGRTVQGTAYADYLYSRSVTGEKVAVYGFEGNDVLYGGYGIDVLVGGMGNDIINAAGGDNIFLYNIGDGNDKIYIANSETGDNILKFGEGIHPENIELKRTGASIYSVNDLTISVPEGSVTIDSWYSKVTARLKEIHFANGIVWTREDISKQPRIVRGTENRDTLGSQSTVGEKVFVYGLGGNDTLSGGQGTDTLIGGLGDDTLNGVGGDNTYIYNKGDGNDRIYITNSATGDNILKFGEGINPEDIEIRRTGVSIYSFDDLTFFVPDGSVTIGGWYAKTTVRLKAIHFANGLVWTQDDIGKQPRIVRGTENRDTLGSQSTVGEKVFVYGLGGNDTISGWYGSDVLIGGPGDDTISGVGGDNTYIYNKGDGHDIISNPSSPGVIDVLQFGEGIRPEDVELRRTSPTWSTPYDYFAGYENCLRGSANNLTLFLSPTESVTLYDWYSRPDTKIEEIRFMNGTVWTPEDIFKMPRHAWGTNRDMQEQIGTLSVPGETVIVHGLAGEDIMYGGNGNDIFIGGLGDDTMVPMGGDDTVVYNPGDGNDQVDFSYYPLPGDFNTIRFGEGINPEDVTAIRFGIVLEAQGPGEYAFKFKTELKLVVPGGSILFYNWFPNGYYGTAGHHAREVHFADGTIWRLNTPESIAQFASFTVADRTPQ